MRERILLMGAPGTGKSKQLLSVVNYLSDLNIKAYVIDLEDKLSATLESEKSTPKNLNLYVAYSWDELVSGTEDDKFVPIMAQIESKIKPEEWLMIDRVDLSWSFTQRWYTEHKYEQDLAEVMMQKAQSIKKSFMVAPRFDQGSWQVINAQYESFIMKVLYKFRANILLTSGIRVPEEGANPMDIYGHVGVAPRGQKELPHQPHSVFLLSMSRSKTNPRELSWVITTAKDLPGREYMDKVDLFDYSLQYLQQYYPAVNK